jgi:hypothetical protein
MFVAEWLSFDKEKFETNLLREPRLMTSKWD